jgi:hypothetical protein
MYEVYVPTARIVHSISVDTNARLLAENDYLLEDTRQKVCETTNEGV